MEASNTYTTKAEKRVTCVSDSTKAASIEANSRTLAGKRIVISETNGIIVLMLNAALSRAGAHVVGLAKSLAECLVIVRREEPELVLVGITPSNAVHTIRVAGQMTHDGETCVVAMMDFDSAETERHLHEAGVSAVIKKPFTSDLLLHTLEETYTESCAVGVNAHHPT